MTKHPDDQIIAEHRAKMNDLAQFLDSMFNKPDIKPKEVCFVLLVAPFGTTEGRVNYISNGERADMVLMLKELLARWEGQPEMKGTA